MFSGQNHAEKVDSAFGQWIYSGKPDFDSLDPFQALLATCAPERPQKSGIDFLEMNSVQVGL
jgi:hypothetical protein